MRMLSAGLKHTLIQPVAWDPFCLSPPWLFALSHGGESQVHPGLGVCLSPPTHHGSSTFHQTSNPTELSLSQPPSNAAPPNSPGILTRTKESLLVYGSELNGGISRHCDRATCAFRASHMDIVQVPFCASNWAALDWR